MKAQRLAVGAGVGIAAASVVAIAVAVVLGLASAQGPAAISASDAFFVAGIGCYPIAAAVVVAHRPRNPVGWYLLMSGAIYGLGILAWQVGISAAAADASHEPAVKVWLAWFGSWATRAAPLALLLGLLRFPDGRTVSRQLRWVGPAASLLGLAVVVAHAVRPGRLNGVGPPNPAALPAGPQVPAWVGPASNAILVVVVTLVIITLAIRYRRAGTTARQQLKWLMMGTAVLPIGIVAGSALGAGAAAGSARAVASSAIYSLGLVGVPVGIAVAMVRHHLYDVDLLISRAIVYLALASGTTAVYIALVVGAGYWVGAGSPSLLLSILATAVIAVAFQPARSRLQVYANRLVYGRRSSPHEALSEFVRRVAEAYEPDRLVREMARAIAEGSLAESVQVWLDGDDGELLLAGVWPEGPVPEHVPADETASLVKIEHRGERLGLIVVRPRAGESLPAADMLMIQDLALHAGLAVRNARLTMELRQRLDELEASRHRLVTAQDTERRRIERDLHDGAQQHLVALRLNLQVALSQSAAPELPELLEQADAALAALRELAHGIHPAVLSDRGLVAALEGATRSAPTAVRIEADNIGRFDPDLEATVYFCCVEAVQNAFKHAHADQIRVRLAAAGGRLMFTVEDDGCGMPRQTAMRSGSGLQNMADRAAAFGGSCEARPGSTRGTVVEGWVPAQVSAARNR